MEIKMVQPRFISLFDFFFIVEGKRKQFNN